MEKAGEKERAQKKEWSVIKSVRFRAVRAWMFFFVWGGDAASVLDGQSASVRGYDVINFERVCFGVWGE